MKKKKIGYVVKRYPRFSETFIVNEILAHESVGLPIEIYSLRPPVDTHFQDLISRVTSPLTYLSAGSVKAQELWEAIRSCSRLLPNTLKLLNAVVDECPLDIYCGVQLAEASVRGGITHLHAHFASSAASVARIASLITGIPYSLTAHAKDIFHDSVSPQDIASKLRDAAVTFTVSDFNADYLKQSFPESSERVVRLYNGLNLSDFPYSSPQHRPRRICAVGRFVEKKGFCDLIDACSILQKQGVEFECVLIGSGELQSLLAQQIQALNLSSVVKLLGPQPQREVKHWIRESAVMAAPCILGSDGNRDGLPTVLLESMALGTPCVSTDVTGIPELVRDSLTGLLVAQNSPSALAEALERLLQDAQLRTELATAARELIACQFDIDRNASLQRTYFSAACFDSKPAVTDAENLQEVEV